MVWFIRSQRPIKGLLIGFALLSAMFFISFDGVAPIPFISLYILTGLLVGLILLLPYLLDRFLTPRFSGFIATLILPVSWVSVDFINASVNPYGEWGIIAYTQSGNLPLLQILSVTGIWGVTFLMAWFASTANWVWENNFEWKKIRKGLAIYSRTLLAVLIFGGLRLSLFAPEAKTVTIASVSVPVPRSSISNLTNEEKAKKVLNDKKIYDELFRLSKKGARFGAKMVLWAEANAQVKKENEIKLIERGRKFAQQENVYLTMSLFVEIPDKYHRENKTITIDPNGKIIATYFKSRPPIGEPSIKGDGIMPVIKTPFGTLSNQICSDMDSPIHIRKQTFEMGTDIMLAPSWDWKKIDPLHTRMAAFRGIELGFSMVRQANDGLSQATDYQGNILSSVDHFHTDENLMMSQVPIKGTKTIYSRIGDTFAWLCVVALSMMIGKIVVRKK